ncbi:helix-turn-helix domain-containing protein [Rossellomorea sp. YZS02]|uniref:helix-turn-helix domain-containing protein n=1 Tax=Rossellomorea sp. YZS02 TaxID=3097358 RepID=UPI002A0C5026|nr:helix-turn-helix domain-containing protein [Rossellomorea sp. YZS02]MDX8343166.1 helix-turn-helix domain-containing protein [Rossellomorea sp. YZS02]
MDYSIVGNKIKELRKAIGLTQGELADGVCTQALISRIEKGDVYPSATSLYQISKKLGVDINFFFEIATIPRLDYVKEVERQLWKLRRARQFEEMIEIVKVEERNQVFISHPYNFQLLLWHKGIYQFEVENDSITSLETLQSAFTLTRNLKKALSEREMEIQLTIGAIQFKENNLAEALECYHKVENSLRLEGEVHNKSIKTRLLYNMARVFSRQSRFEESIECCQEGIRWCIDTENLHLLAELHYHIGYNYELQNNFVMALSHIEKALLIFEMKEDKKYYHFLNEKRNVYINKLSE